MMGNEEEDFITDSQRTEYSLPVRQTHWDKTLMGYPKDYDIKEPGNISVHRSAYKRLGIDDMEFPLTSYQEQCQQLALKPFYKQHTEPASMINEKLFGHIPWQRNTGAPEEGFGSLLPHHTKPYPKNYFQTFYNINYPPPFPYKPQPSKAELEYCTKHRKCHSQFTDTADYRRHNLNTWQNETGIYANPRKPKEKTLDGMM